MSDGKCMECLMWDKHGYPDDKWGVCDATRPEPRLHVVPKLIHVCGGGHMDTYQTFGCQLHLRRGEQK